MRTFLWAYLRQRRRAVLAWAVLCLIFAVGFWLYHLPLEAVFYPALVSAALGLLYAAADLGRCYALHRKLQRLKESVSVSVDPLPVPDTMEGKDYQELVKLLVDRQMQQESRLTRQYNDMIGYYTLWAHQIKTPIASMKLQLQSRDDAPSRQLSSELNRIEQYVEMVLAYLRLGSASTDYVFREVDVDRLVRAAIRRFSGDFITRRLSVDYRPIHERVVTDEKWLSFVIEQVLSNAIKYTPEGGVSITWEEPGTLCIRDSGIGIAPEDLPRIFENGFTGLNGRSDQKASGLGLHLCRRVCTALGHEISIQSQPDQGTCVRIGLYKPPRSFE